MTDRSLINFCWLGAGATLCFFAVSFGRIDLGIYHFAIPVLFVTIILFFGILMFLMPNLRLHQQLEKVVREYKVLVVLTYLFFLWHLVGFIKTIDVDVGFKDVIKIFIGTITFWATIIFFPRDKKFIETFFVVSFYGWLVMLVRLIYQYAFVFHMPFLSTDLDMASRWGKNQLAVHLVVIFFYASFYLWRSKKKLPALIPFSVIFISIVYSGSRMSWIATTIGAIFLIIFIIWQNRTEGLRLLKYFVIGGGIFLTLTILILSNYVDLTENSNRLLAIYAPDKLDDANAHLGKNSYATRGNALLQSWHGFLTAPITGVGLRNTIYYVDRITHNDYMAILLELGVVGIVLFLAIIWNIWKKSSLPAQFKSRKLPWFSFAARGSVIGLLICSNFFNSYGSAYYWFYLALLIVLTETERSPEENEIAYSQ